MQQAQACPQCDMHRQTQREAKQMVGTVIQQMFVWSGAYGGKVRVTSSLLQYQVRPLGTPDVSRPEHGAEPCAIASWSPPAGLQRDLC